MTGKLTAPSIAYNKAMDAHEKDVEALDVVLIAAKRLLVRIMDRGVHGYTYVHEGSVCGADVGEAVDSIIPLIGATWKTDVLWPSDECDLEAWRDS